MLAENTFLNRDTYYVTPPSLPRDRIARMNARNARFPPSCDVRKTAPLHGRWGCILAEVAPPLLQR